MKKLHLNRFPSLYVTYSVTFIAGLIVGQAASNKIYSFLCRLQYYLNNLASGKCSLHKTNSSQKADVPENAPEHCPGLKSDDAGKAEACAGCPNKDICASGDAKREDPLIQDLNKNLRDIKKKILVLSGKGGVGKSTVTAQLGWLYQELGLMVGVLDVDICGPSIPLMTGSRGMDVHSSSDGWSPVYVENNLAIMSIAYLIPNETEAVIWRGPKKNGLIRQFLTDVNWGPLDVLVVDTPPGTSDEHLSIVTYLKQIGIDGAIIVTTPQEVALIDVRREIMFCKTVGIRVLGMIENMKGSDFDVSPNQLESISPAQATCESMNIPYLGIIPSTRELAQACEAGISIAKASSENSEITKSIHSLGHRILHDLNLALPKSNQEN